MRNSRRKLRLLSVQRGQCLSVFAFWRFQQCLTITNRLSSVNIPSIPHQQLESFLFCFLSIEQSISNLLQHPPTSQFQAKQQPQHCCQIKKTATWRGNQRKSLHLDEWIPRKLKSFLPQICVLRYVDSFQLAHLVQESFQLRSSKRLIERDQIENKLTAWRMKSVMGAKNSLATLLINVFVKINLKTLKALLLTFYRSPALLRTQWQRPIEFRSTLINWF